VSREAERVQAFVDEHRDVVVKRLDVMGGENVFRVRHDDPNRNVIIETISQGGRRTVMAQRYIPEIKDGDKRVILIDGKLVPHCLARIPKAASRAATSPPARAAWRSRSPSGIARSRRPWVRSLKKRTARGRAST
jgi:glutathione synthase/RimK-type ligase-like ATP-grasp enzyme